MNWYNRSHHKAFHEGRTTCTTCGRVFTRINQLRVHHQRDPCGLAQPAQADQAQAELAAQAAAAAQTDLSAQAAAVAQAVAEPGQAVDVERSAPLREEDRAGQTHDVARGRLGAE